MERNQKGGRVEKHKATPTEATIYLPNCLLDLCPLCISVPYLKIRPFLSPPPTPQKSLCIAHKMRLTFILQRKIVSYQPRPRNLVFSQVKHVLRSMWLKIYMTHDQLFPNSVFFFNKNAVATPFQILFVLSSKTRLAPNVAVTLCAMRPAAPTFLFFRRNPRRTNPATFLARTFLVFFQVKCVLASQVTVGSHVTRPTAPWFHKIFPRKTRLAGGTPRRHCHWQFSFVPKPGRRQMLTKEHCM